MKRILLLMLSLAVFVSCKKKEEAAPAAPEPVKTGSITLNVLSYDSLGDVLANHSGIRVILNSSNSATTGVSGSVTFNNIEYGTQYPSLLKDGYDGPPTGVTLNSASTSSTLPFPKRSAFKVQNYAGQAYNKDSIIITFNLDRAMPAGKYSKIAIITGTVSGVNASNFEVVDIVTANSSSGLRYNISKLPAFNTWLVKLDSNALFFVNAIPLSYGLYVSNLTTKPVLLGENLFVPDNLVFKKNWI
ncbi:MAG: hypothetical protein PSX36_02940 [bacterium]|nr:hypothetical protein [bacterium]